MMCKKSELLEDCNRSFHMLSAQRHFCAPGPPVDHLCPSEPPTTEPPYCTSNTSKLAVPCTSLPNLLYHYLLVIFVQCISLVFVLKFQVLLSFCYLLCCKKLLMSMMTLSSFTAVLLHWGGLFHFTAF